MTQSAINFNPMTERLVEGPLAEVSPGVFEPTWVLESVFSDDDVQKKIAAEHGEMIRRKYIQDHAADLMRETDFVSNPLIVDINAVPRLVNVDEFNAYRHQLQEIIDNKTLMYVEWPTKPEAVWAFNSL